MKRSSDGVFGNTVTGRKVSGHEIALQAGGGDTYAEGVQFLQQRKVRLRGSDIPFKFVNDEIIVLYL
ncbi:MAG: hypothetical protein NVS1B11_09060 [Terriglobales bacterium]